MTKRYVMLCLGLLAVVLVAAGFLVGGGQPSQAAAATSSSLGVQSSAQAQLPTLRPTVSTAVHFDVSPPLRDMARPETGPGQYHAITEGGPNGDTHSAGPKSNSSQADSFVQRFIGPLVIPTPIISFDGPPNLCGGCAPPDPNGEVGPNHYVVMTNLDYQIFNKSGVSVLGPSANNTLWAGFGGGCQTQNAGDPIVLYDQLADRWFLSQFTAAAPFFNCVALSQTNDPTGAYYRWAFPVGGGANFGDYPKYGMWPNAYYISTREFQGTSGPFQGVGAYALNRVQMLAGNPTPAVISFLAPPTPAYLVGDGLLPADLDGTTLPPAGSDEYYVGSEDDNGGYGAPSDALTLWKFHVDFPTPANSTFTLANTIASAPFNSVLALCSGGRACIPQPGTTNKIDHQGYRQRPLFRLAYRNMGTYESLVTNQSVSAGTGPSGEVSGIRWWELRSPASSPIIFQQGTYAPGLTDGIHRWMGSIAMDRQGDMALGYSAANATLFPSIYYTGRLVTDPLGLMPQGEGSIVTGTGSQTGGGNRWGDYTDMTVDPVDDCTFWYVNEYVPTTSAAGWRARIGSFKFPGCGAGAGTATPTVTGTPPTSTRTSTPTSTSTSTNTPTVTPTPNSCLVQNYTIATSTGTVVAATTLVPGSNCDDCVNAITMPFPFRLYDQTFTTVNASSNGNLQFLSSSTDFTNACLPAPQFNYAILPHWDDLVLTGTGQGIFTLIEGTAPNRTLDIEWKGSYFPASGTVDFEVRLHEGSGTFEFIYGTLTQGGSSATIGVQRDTGSHFTQYECNTGGITAGLMLTFSQPPCATPTVGSTSTRTPAATSTACPVQFTDVPNGSTFYPYIRCLACRGIVSGYADGTFRPNNNVTRGQLSKIVANSAGFSENHTTQDFQDVPVGSTFYIWIERLYSRGIIGGYPCGGPFEPCGPGNLPYFRPNNNATRGQITKIDANAAGYSDPPVGQQFQDVPVGSTFYTYTYQLVTRGIMSGYPCSGPGEPCVPPGNLPYFRPNNNATRGQTSKIVANTFFPNCQTPQGVKR